MVMDKTVKVLEEMFFGPINACTAGPYTPGRTNWEIHNENKALTRQRQVVQWDPAFDLDTIPYTPQVTRGTYSYLLQYLQADEKVQADFDAFEQTYDDKCADRWGYQQLPVMDAYAVKYAEGTKYAPEADNTYNHEHTLSCDFKYCWLDRSPSVTENQDNHILVQLHVGCDVRAGYSNVYAFICSDPHEFLRNLQVSYLECSECGAQWCAQSIRDAEALKFRPVCAGDHDIAYPAEDNELFDTKVFIVPDKAKVLSEYPQETYDSLMHTTQLTRRSKLVYNEETEQMYCPYCGLGHLK